MVIAKTPIPQQCVMIMENSTGPTGLACDSQCSCQYCNSAKPKRQCVIMLDTFAGRPDATHTDDPRTLLRMAV